MNPLSFDDLFVSTGLFGLEVAGATAALAGRRVTLRGFLYGPLGAGGEFVLGRGGWRACPCCGGEPRWPDDVAIVRLRAGEPDAGLLPDRDVTVTGTLELGDAPSAHPGLASSVRLLDAELDRFR
jgi:hypothetical protein